MRGNIGACETTSFLATIVMTPKTIKQEAQSDVVSSELKSQNFNITTHVQKNKRTPRTRPAKYNTQVERKLSGSTSQTKRSSSFRGVTRYSITKHNICFTPCHNIGHITCMPQVFKLTSKSPIAFCNQ